MIRVKLKFVTNQPNLGLYRYFLCWLSNFIFTINLYWCFWIISKWYLGLNTMISINTLVWKAELIFIARMNTGISSIKVIKFIYFTAQISAHNFASTPYLYCEPGILLKMCHLCKNDLVFICGRLYLGPNRPFSNWVAFEQIIFNFVLQRPCLSLISSKSN